MMLGWWMLACAQPPGAGHPYLIADTDTDTPDFDADAIASAIASAVETVRELRAGPVIEGYFQLLGAGMDENCPTWMSSPDGAPYWFDTCTAQTGTSFDGYATHNEIVDQTDDDGITWTGTTYSGFARISDAGGTKFASSGDAASLTGTDANGERVWYTEMGEGFSYNGPQSQGTWLEMGEAATWWTFARWAWEDPSTGSRAAMVDARITIFDGTAGAVVFDDMLVEDSIRASDCHVEPTGTISILDANDTWTTMVFVPPADPADCDGCTSAWADGLHLGEVCTDLSDLLDWADQPWETP